MVRTRLILIVTIAALLAPCIAPCLLQAPAGHAVMPCCKPAGDGVPVARPCCGPADGDTSLPPSSVASRVQPAQVMAPAPAPAIASLVAVSRHVDPQRFFAPPVSARLRSTVLLI